MNYISLKALKEGKFDDALKSLGYLRTSEMAEKWGMTVNQLNSKFSKGYTCDCFKVNGIRYISVDAVRPE